MESAGKYVLGPTIATGGMGAVHVARVRGAADFSRVVAVKRMRRSLGEDPQFVTMFLDEARMASRIRHANVVPTLDVLEVDRELWIVMEYIAGGSLSSLLREGPVPPSIASAIFHDALAGLDAAHRATDATGALLGLVHRDVSPHNVLVGTDGVARLTDFGIAKAANRKSVTLQVGFKGKVQYAAPEVLRGDTASVQADIWSMSVSLWEALVGEHLFIGANQADLLFQILETRPALPSARAPSAGTAFDGVLARGLDPDPARRFPSAAAMLEALEACGTPAPAREVAAWVEATVAPALRTRAELVRAVETGALASSGESAAAIVSPDERTTVDGPPSSTISVSAPTRAATDRMPAHAPSRAATTERMPAHAPSPPQPNGTPLASTEPPRPAEPTRSSAGMLIAIAVAALGVVGAVALASFASRRAPAARAESPADAAASVVAAAPIPVASQAPTSPSFPAPPPTGTPTTTASAPEPHKPARRATSTPTQRPSAPAAAATADPCDPPWTIDEAGDKVYKRQCVKR